MPIAGKGQNPENLGMGILAWLYQACTPMRSLESEVSVNKNSWCRSHASEGGRGDLQLPQTAAAVILPAAACGV